MLQVVGRTFLRGAKGIYIAGSIDRVDPKPVNAQDTCPWNRLVIGLAFNVITLAKTCCCSRSIGPANNNRTLAILVEAGGGFQVFD